MEEPDEAHQAHRQMAVQLNNQVWDVLDAASLGPDATASDREELLYAAYASAYHWRVVGTAANHARGEHLISRAAALAGQAQVALRHAHRCIELCESAPDEVTDWDLAFGHEALARALAAAGQSETATEARARAERFTAAIADAQDRAVVEGELAREPWFGLTD